VVEQSKFRTRFRVVKTAVAWGELDRLPCAIKLLPNPKKTIGFEQYEGATSSWAHDPGGPHPAPHVLFAPGDEGGVCTGHPGTGRTCGPVDDAALHAPEPELEMFWTRARWKSEAMRSAFAASPLARDRFFA
jgi:hypothetical protein